MDTPEAVPVLVAEIAVVVHPVDTTIHPAIPAGYRWAVMVGGRPPADLAYCVQAGHDPVLEQAMVAGEMVGAACAQALRKLGTPARYAVKRLDWDPLPAAADGYPIAEFR